jgi:beta-lactamase class D
MPKVTELKFDIKGKDYKIAVNCNSSGEFTANLPDEVAEALRIMAKQCHKTLASLQNEIEQNIKKYKQIQTTYETFIIVAYQARGKYIEDENGGHMFYCNNENYKIDVAFSGIANAIGLDFKVAVKETIDGKEKWFEGELQDDGTYAKGRQTIRNSMIKRGKIIPFNQDALNTLNSVQEKFRALSQRLFEFINKDETEILQILTNKKLLN